MKRLWILPLLLLLASPAWGAFEFAVGSFTKIVNAACIGLDDPQDCCTEGGDGTCNTAGANMILTGVGFIPEAMMFFSDAKTSTGNSADANSAFGMCDTTTEFTVSQTGENALSRTDQSSGGADDCLQVQVAGAGTVQFAFSMVSFDADGFEIDMNVNSATAFIVRYIAFGGTDLTGSKVLKFDAPAAPGSRNDTGFGFNPVALFMVVGGRTSVGTNNDSTIAIGAGTGASNRWALANTADDNRTSESAMHTWAEADAIMLYLSRGGTPSIDFEADLTSFVTDGYALDWVTTVDGRDYSTLGFLGGQYASGCFNKTTDAATAVQDIDVGFEPVGVIVSSMHNITSAGLVTDMKHSFGASDGTNEVSIAVENLDETFNTVANTHSSVAKGIALFTGPSTVDSEADITFTGDNVRFSWTTNEAVADEICYIAFGNAAEGGPARRVMVVN